MKPSRFRWTARKEEAAMLIARDELTDQAIAASIGMTRDGLSKLKRRPEFQQRVAELSAAFAEAIRGRGIADLQNRVDALNDRWNQMRRLMEARKIQYADVPGGDTGLLVRVGPRRPDRGSGRRGDPGQLGLWEGEDEPPEAEATDALDAEYTVDAVLLRALLDHEKQAAQELGQWQVERETESTVVIREYVGIDPDKV